MGPVEQRGQTAEPGGRRRLDAPRPAPSPSVFPPTRCAFPLYQAYRACSGATAAGEAQAGFRARRAQPPAAGEGAESAPPAPAGAPAVAIESCAIHSGERIGGAAAAAAASAASRGAPRAPGGGEKMDAPARSSGSAPNETEDTRRAPARAAAASAGGPDPRTPARVGKKLDSRAACLAAAALGSAPYCAVFAP